MRLAVMVAAITLCLAAPARAGLITLEIFGVITGAGLQGPSEYPAPTPPAAGSAFTLFYVLEYLEPNAPLFPVTVTFGEYTGTFYCNFCKEAVLNPLQAVEILVADLNLTNAQNEHLRGTLLWVTLNAGWQSGSFTSYLETASHIGGVSGTITGVRSTVSVPEPATALLLGLGAIVVMRLQRTRSRRTAA